MLDTRQAMWYLATMSKTLKALKLAVETSDQTRYQIAKGSGVSQGQLSRLVNDERGLSMATAEQLADYLGLEIAVRPKPTRKKGR